MTEEYRRKQQAGKSWSIRSLGANVTEIHRWFTFAEADTKEAKHMRKQETRLASGKEREKARRRKNKEKKRLHRRK